MIQDLSLTLQAILDDPSLAAKYPELAAAQIAFDRPDENFKPAQTTIDLYLFDVRENTELKSNEPIIERKNGQTLTHPGPVRLSCSYLITAWPVGGTDLALQEQRLLSEVFQVLSAYPKIPDSFLKGQLSGQTPPLPMVTTHPDDLKNPSEFWTAIGNKLRTSLTVTATLTMEVFTPVAAPLTTTSVLRVGERLEDQEVLIPATMQQVFRIGGTVTSAGNPVAGATVTLGGSGLAARTDADGQYIIGVVKSGAYVLQVQSGTSSKQVNINIPATAGSNYDVQL
jgi:Pvc16 N-terminal domain/Carboxypeptidase regulatory-like domain